MCISEVIDISPSNLDSSLYFNKTLLHKSSEQSSLIIGPRLISSPLEAKNPGIFHSSATTFQKFMWLSSAGQGQK